MAQIITIEALDMLDLSMLSIFVKSSPDAGRQETFARVHLKCKLV